MAKRSGVEIRADFSEMAFTMGLVSGMAKTVRTNRYQSDVIEYVHGDLSRSFDEHLDQLRDLAPQRFHHVYEWNTRGGKDLGRDRLWEHKLMGSGGTRNATWAWLASTKPIPSPAERAKNPNDPMSKVPAEEVAKLSQRNYFFYWKAPVMEYNTPVNIEPVNGKMIFIPTGDPSQPFVFSAGARVMNPGGQETTGAFTTAWTEWWGQAAPKVFDSTLQETLEMDTANSVREGVRVGQRQRSNAIGLNATTDFQAAFESGEAWATKNLFKKSGAYKRMRRN
jgi:hypothetical protein